MAQASRSMESFLSSNKANFSSYVKKEIERDEDPFALPSEVPAVKQESKPNRWKNNTSNNASVDEQILVREIIFAFQGISSDHIYLDATTNNFEVDKALNISERKPLFFSNY